MPHGASSMAIGDVLLLYFNILFLSTHTAYDHTPQWFHSYSRARERVVSSSEGCPLSVDWGKDWASNRSRRGCKTMQVSALTRMGTARLNYKRERRRRGAGGGRGSILAARWRASEGMARNEAGSLRLTSAEEIKESGHAEVERKARQNAPKAEANVMAKTLPPASCLSAAVVALMEELQAIEMEKTDDRAHVRRLEIPLPRKYTALTWLGGQRRAATMMQQSTEGASFRYPLIYFSPRRCSAPETDGSLAAKASSDGMMSTATSGTAWMWKGERGRPVDEEVLASLCRFLSPEQPRLRVFGGCRFDATSEPAPEWKEFGTFLFVLPRIELLECPGSLLLACTVAWDPFFQPSTSSGGEALVERGFASRVDAVEDAIASLKNLVDPLVGSLSSPILRQTLLGHMPDRSDWDARLRYVYERLAPSSLDNSEESLSNEADKDREDSVTSFVKLNPDAALIEYIRNGQQGLDDLLAALDDRNLEALMEPEDACEDPTATETRADDSSNCQSNESINIDSHVERLTKVVLARRTDLSLDGTLDPVALVRGLQDKDPRAYQVMIQLPSGTTFVSSTPECLYSRTGRYVVSEAVAGTRARGPGGDVEKDFWLSFDLLRSTKDDAEFSVVRDWVRRALGNVCDTVVVEVAKSVLKQGSVQHLYSKIAGRLRRGANDASLLKALHPTPAVCGQPRAHSLRILNSVEGFDRGFYAGPFGWIGGDAAEFVVAIRSALVHSRQDVEATFGESRETRPENLTSISLFAGVGIVSGSDTSSEWSELDLKIRQYERLLAPVPSLNQSPNEVALWARLMVEELCRLGCNTFCVAPGSRSSPLTVAAAQHPYTRIVPCVDERSLGFYAVGYGKASRRPAVVITSSGTAVANLLPSVVEASMSHVPLVVLTADRPAELRDTGSNQTIDQVGIYGSYVRWQYDMLPPSDDVPARMVLTTIDAAVNHAVGGGYGAGFAGPVHVNCQFREPLAPSEKSWNTSCLEGLDRWWHGTRPFTTSVSSISGKDERSIIPPQTAAFKWNEVTSVISRAEKGLIVVGEVVDPEDLMAVVQLARLLRWPVAADILSGLRLGVRSQYHHEGEDFSLILSHFDHILLLDKESWHSVQPDVILQIGGHLTSKRLARFLEWCALEATDGVDAQIDVRASPSQWIYVEGSLRRIDQSHLVTHKVQASVSSLVDLLREEMTIKGRCEDETVEGLDGTSGHRIQAIEQERYLKLLKLLDRAVSDAVDLALNELEDEITEPGIARILSRDLPPGEGVFIGNSMPIRDLDMYAAPIHIDASNGVEDKNGGPFSTNGTTKEASLSNNDASGGDEAEDTARRKGVFPESGSRVMRSMSQAVVVGSGIGAPVAANRGASGIDGVVSTAAGFADGLGRGSTLLIGDLSFIHDSNGLTLLKNGESRPPLTIVLINNSGGGIFSFLPIADAVPKDMFEPLWSTPQNVDLAGLCRAHGIPHLAVFTPDDFRVALQSSWSLNRHSIIEVITNKSVNVERHRHIQDAARKAATEVLLRLQHNRGNIKESSLADEEMDAQSSLSWDDAGMMQRGFGGKMPGKSVVLAASDCGGHPSLQNENDPDDERYEATNTELDVCIIRADVRSIRMKLQRPLTTAMPSDTSAESFRYGFMIELQGVVANSDGTTVQSQKEFVTTDMNMHDASVVIGRGEIAPLPGLHKETLNECLGQLQLLCCLIDGRISTSLNAFREKPASLDTWFYDTLGIDPAWLFPSVRFGLETALLQLFACAYKTMMKSIDDNGQREGGLSNVVLLSMLSKLSQNIDDSCCSGVVRINGLLDPLQFQNDPTTRSHQICSQHDIPAVVEEATRMIRDMGFQCLKIKVGRCVCPLEDAKLIVAIRESLGPDVCLRADANQAWTFEQAKSFAVAARDAQLEYCEEPLINPKDIWRLHLETGMHFALDESIDEGLLVDAMFESTIDKVSQENPRQCQGLAAVVLKPSVLGSYSRTLEIAHQAKILGITPVISSAFDFPFGLYMLGQLAVVVDALAGPTYHGLGTLRWFDMEDVSSMEIRSWFYDDPEMALTWQSAKADASAGLSSWQWDVLCEAVAKETRKRRFTAFQWQVEISEEDSGRTVTMQVPVVELKNDAAKQLSRPPVIFLHGFLGSPNDWRPLMSALHYSTGCHCLSLGLPTIVGGEMQHETSHSLDQASHALQVLLSSREDIAGATLVGYSLGARLALLVASKVPQLLSGVVAVSGHAGIEDPRLRAERASLDDERASALMKCGLEAFLDSWYQASMWDSFRAHPSFEKIVKQRAKSQQDQCDLLASILSGMSPGRTAPAIDALAARARDGTLCPLLLVAGEKDTKFSRHIVDVKERLDADRVDAIVIPGVGHAVLFEDPLALFEVLRSFVENTL